MGHGSKGDNMEAEQHLDAAVGGRMLFVQGGYRQWM